jgi:hypothetical protein
MHIEILGRLVKTKGGETIGYRVKTGVNQYRDVFEKAGVVSLISAIENRNNTSNAFVIHKEEARYLRLRKGVLEEIFPSESVDEGIRSPSILGTGEGCAYASDRFAGLQKRDGKEVSLYRVMSEGEYLSILKSKNKFVPYEFSLEKKWFAVSIEHARAWADWFYPDGVYRLLEIVVLEKALELMFFLKKLDNIGPAYSADVVLLNKVVRRLRFI